MFATRVLSVAALFASLAAAISLEVPTEWKQCERVQLIGKGKGSLNLAILDQDDQCGDSRKEWLNVQSATFNYTVPQTIAVGTKLLVLIEENGSEAEEWSAPITVVEGDCGTNAAPGTETAGTETAGTETGGNNFAPTNTDKVTPPSTTGTGSDGGVANVGSSPNKSTDGGDNGVAARAGVSAALVFGAAVLAMAL